MAMDGQVQEYDSNYGKQYNFLLKNQAPGLVHCLCRCRNVCVCVCVFQTAYSTEKQKWL